MKKLNLLVFLITLSACVEQAPGDRPDIQNQAVENSTTISTLQRSQAFRTSGKKQYFESELAVLARGDKPLTDFHYFNLPTIANHNEGSKNIPVGPDSIDCDGDDVDADTLDEFRNYCRSRLATKKRTWFGSENGTAGEGDWRMVAKIISAGKGYEVWEDLSTGLIWSDIVTEETWCKASGNRDAACSPADLATLPCFGSADVQVEMGKGNLNKIAKVIDWRLPTRNEYLQADLNGIRNVIPAFRRSLTAPASTTNPVLVWTATTDSQDNTKAWLYDGRYGVLSSETMTEERSVICVGRVLIP
ncbi:MAG: DUF1566 domain-containing protein [Bacteriovoracaceae bacterium]|nr:DUF1566 domain-containing protein [Bacteriovoracaceae bacterium]